MIKKTLLLSFLLFLGINPLVAQTEACSRGDLNTSDYQFRESEGFRRCEGIRRRQIDRSLDLVSLTVGRLQPSNQLTLEIPSPEDHPPALLVQYPVKNYQLDHANLHFMNGAFQMQWSDHVLQMAEIPAESLFARADIAPSGTHTSLIYVPVILDPSAEKYEFVFQCSDCEAKIKDIRVVNGAETMLCGNNIGDSRTLRFFCDGRNDPSGKYTLRVTYDIKLDESSSYKSALPIVAPFKHNPQWLK